MRSIIERAGRAANDLSGGRLQRSALLTRLYNRATSGVREFDGFRLYVPPEAPIEDDGSDEFLASRFTDRRVWDAGANVGYFTLRAAQRARSVHAFEPEPYNYEILERNLDLNGTDNGHAHRVAVSNENGTATLHRTARSGAGIHSLAANEQLEATPETVPTRRVDSLVDEYGAPDVVKVDVEGAEQKVVEGATDTILSGDVDWFVEVHVPETGLRDDRLGEHGGDAGTLYALFADHDYEVFGYAPETDTLERFDPSGDSIPLYWYATRDPPEDAD